MGSSTMGLNTIPEPVLKKRKRQEKAEEKQMAKRAMERTKGIAKRTKDQAFVRAEKCIEAFRMRERSLSHLKRKPTSVAAARLSATKVDELVFVLRLPGPKVLHTKVLRILRTLRLNNENEGVFLQASKVTMKNLSKVEAYVAYGHPSLKTVRQLIMMHGFAFSGGERQPMTNNQMVEDLLSDKTEGSVICTEDLIHHIHIVGPHFADVLKCLSTFKLTNPKAGFSRIKKQEISAHEVKRGNTDINTLVAKML